MDISNYNAVHEGKLSRFSIQIFKRFNSRCCRWLSDQGSMMWEVERSGKFFVLLRFKQEWRPEWLVSRVGIIDPLVMNGRLWHRDLQKEEMRNTQGPNVRGTCQDFRLIARVMTYENVRGGKGPGNIMSNTWFQKSQNLAIFLRTKSPKICPHGGLGRALAKFLSVHYIRH